MDEKNKQKVIDLAYDVLTLSRNTLLVKLRFLDMALSMFELSEIEDSSMMTDGKNLFFNPGYVLKRYKSERETVVRDYLHIVLHCIFRHMFIGPSIDRPTWDLAVDIAVENMITEIGLKEAESFRQRRQEEEIKKLQKAIGTLTAEKIYRYLLDKNYSQSQAANLRGLFYADNHEIWYMTVEQIEIKYGSSNAQNSNFAELEPEWKKISERMQVDMETFSDKHGNLGGSLTQNLKEVNRDKYDYTAFLKKFAVLGEAMKINDDEFDYVYYTYGLQLFENMPLIEPLEYKDVKRIREFVIAIDTSGSVAGDTVQKFVEKTYNILKSTESFFSKINIHIIQCDAQIQEHVKITSQEEFDKYLEKMDIHGLGGTDFRPVFAEVNELVEQGEFNNLKGLIYFTDGYGDFPTKKPTYETAFVFLEQEDNNYEDIPAWAIKLVLREDEI